MLFGSGPWLLMYIWLVGGVVFAFLVTAPLFLCGISASLLKCQVNFWTHEEEAHRAQYACQGVHVTPKVTAFNCHLRSARSSTCVTSLCSMYNHVTSLYSMYSPCLETDIPETFSLSPDSLSLCFMGPGCLPFQKIAFYSLLKCSSR